VRNIHVAEWNTWKTSASLIGQWALLALGLHLLWEFGQLPFYMLWKEGEAWRIALYVMHCVLGDVMIATLSYLAVALIWRQVNWPRQRLRTGGMMLIAIGLGYTVFSEWYNVYRIGAWVYSDAMPLIYGIGITPLLQWLVVPGVMLLLIRRTRFGRSWRKLSGTPSFIFLN
jgi:branched-subunit amino acid ABC-type transport system permease component